MKILTLIALILFCTSALAKKSIIKQVDVTKYPEIKIKIAGMPNELECTLDDKVSTYVCPNKETPILVKSNFMGFVGVGKNQESKIKEMFIEQVVSGDDVLMKHDLSYLEDKNSKFKLNESNELKSQYEDSSNLVNSFFGTGLKLYGAKEKERPIGTDSYESAARQYLLEHKKFEEKVKEIFREGQYQVELATGETINCKRGRGRQRDPSDQFNPDEMCASFACDKVTLDGVEYKATLLYESNPGGLTMPDLILANESGLGPIQNIRRIKSKKAIVPLIDNSYWLDNPDPAMDLFKKSLMSNIPESFARRELAAKFKTPGYSQFVDYAKFTCDTNDKSLDDVYKGREQLFEELANLEVAEFIQVLADGSLVGNYIDATNRGRYGCLYDGLVLNPEAARNLDKIKKNIRPDQNVTETISAKRAQELFSKATAMKDISWNYKPDGCYARAHLMARRFEEEGVRVDKVWIKGDLTVPDFEPEINWNFHVAPIVYVDDGKGGIKKMVIDPSLFDRPVTVEEWDNKMTKNTKRGSVVTAFPFPENAAALERAALAFSSSDPYLPRDSIHLSEEDKMKLSRETMDQYLKVGNQ